MVSSARSQVTRHIARSAYKQISIKEDEKKSIAFEASSNYQFCYKPFDVTKAVSCFQLKIDKTIQDENLKRTLAYLENVTVYGVTEEEQDRK